MKTTLVFGLLRTLAASKPYSMMAFALLMPVVCTDAGQALDSKTFDDIKPSVVRILSTGCSNGGRAGGGFLWAQPDRVVTTLHLVAGCNTISISSEISGSPQIATIEKALIKEDLAFLSIPSAFPSTAPLKAAAPTPMTPGDELNAIGYPLNIPKMNNITLKYRLGSTILKDDIPSEVADLLVRAGSPDPNIEIVPFQGHLEPGSSGSPIVNTAGDVVAVADGGLDGGAADISWAIPVKDLSLLIVSTNSIAFSPALRSSQLFSVPVPSVGGGYSVTCGTEQFSKIRTLAGPEIFKGTDDVAGLQQLVGAVDVQQLRFDVYQDVTNGATFVVPANSPVQQSSGNCLTGTADGSIVIRIVGAFSTTDPTGAQSISAFEHSSFGPLGWQIDPRWTYGNPISRADGLSVERKMLIHFSVNPQFGGSVDAALFETLATRNGHFLGVAAENKKWTPAVINTQQACRANKSPAPYCVQPIQDSINWAEAVLSVHLATFSIG